MVPSRSRKTAGRSALVSDRAHLHRRNPVTRGGFHGGGCDVGHATVIRRAAAEKTRTAVRLFLNDAAMRRDRGRAEGICWSEDGNDRETYGGGYMHRARVVSNKKMALRKHRWQIIDGSLSREIDRRMTHARCDS